MSTFRTLVTALAVLVALSSLTGCGGNPSKPADPAPVAASTPAPAPAPAAEPTPGTGKKDKVPAVKTPATTTAKAGAKTPAAAPAPAAASTGGYDLSKNKPVSDSTKAEAGQGTRVKGINDWEGEISGLPAANSRFTKLRIGMPYQQAMDLVGVPPTDQGAYITGKAFIPFYHGSDRSRWETVFKGQGRLIFADNAGFGSGRYLVWIIHNSQEQGYR